jgi:hypothetical protein
LISLPPFLGIIIVILKSIWLRGFLFHRREGYSKLAVAQYNKGYPKQNTARKKEEDYMRKLFVMVMAMVLVFVFTVPVFALENIFGGSFRTRAYYQHNFTGNDTGSPSAASPLTSGDVRQVDTRTRLYYTAKFSDDFKFVNKFEFGDAAWGGPTSSYTDISADGRNFEIKNSYVDFTLAPVNFKIGVQGATLNRGFLFDDDFAGAVVTYNASKDIAIPFIWVKAFEGGYGKDRNDFDVDYYIVNPSIKTGGATIAPIFAWAYSKDASSFDNVYANPNLSLPATPNKLSIYYVGADVDLTAGPASIWFTGLYEGGKADVPTKFDISAYLFALGASADVNNLNVHGQVFYASGDDDPTDNDLNLFWVPAGQSYYWSEIMGYGIFDNQASAGAPADQIGNVMAANVGVTVKPMPKLSVTADLWYAQLAKDNVNGDKDLGTEIDLIASYKIFDNLTLDAVAAYLFAGDATVDPGVSTKNTENPIEIGTQLSLSF